jgi:hypothetical protein
MSWADRKEVKEAREAGKTPDQIAKQDKAREIADYRASRLRRGLDPDRP